MQKNHKKMLLMMKEDDDDTNNIKITIHIVIETHINIMCYLLNDWII